MTPTDTGGGYCTRGAVDAMAERIVDEVTDGYNAWSEIWLCAAPPVGVKYRVLSDEWTEDLAVRFIRCIELVNPATPPAHNSPTTRSAPGVAANDPGAEAGLQRRPTHA
jgi:hypothetical protein